jgi:hypothetical protein
LDSADRLDRRLRSFPVRPSHAYFPGGVVHLEQIEDFIRALDRAHPAA